MDQIKQQNMIQQFKGHTRLPNFAIPKRYDLHLNTDLSASTFSGTVLIDLKVVEATKVLVLNSLELHVHEVCFTSSSNQYRPSDVVLDGEDEILVLVFEEVLSVGEGVLRIEFSAATFKITLDVPQELMALSNMPIVEEKLNGKVKTVYFEESPIMSTYLVGIVIGLFDYVEDITADGVKVRVYCPVGKSDKGQFALEVAVKTLELYTKYFSMRYPLPKLDLVAVPEFAAGAMENYGLIVYRENELLYDPLHSTTARKQRNAIVAAHEVAHQWFGNLVTMEWWTHLWLNEGFATWVEIHHARSIEQIFDAISYNKGSALIRMLQSYLGDELFQHKSLSSYIKRYVGKNAKTEDLWVVLSEESGIKVESLMDAWTKAKGYPVVSVKAKGHTLEFQQAQFQSSGLHGDGQWIIPITLAVGLYEKNKNFLLETKFGEVDVSDLQFGEHLWIKVNVDQSGFYRVKYDDNLEARLRKAVENNSLSAIDKFGILDDAYALCVSGERSLSSLLSLIKVYKREIDYVVLSKLIDICYDVVEIVSEAIPDITNELKQFFINLLLFPAEKLGWEAIPGESHFNRLLRGEVLRALAFLGHEGTHREGLQRFQSFLYDRNTPLLSADTREAAHIVVMRNCSSSNRESFESILDVYREPNTVLQVKEQILRWLASCPDPNIVVESLNFFVSEEVRDQDITYGIYRISFECREEKWDMILARYGTGMLLTHFIEGIVTLLCSDGKAEEVEAFFANRTYPSIAMTLKKSIEKIRIRARWVHNIREEHDSDLLHLVMQLAAPTN
ncbi:Puromycin-sensitive aminopeptidase [Morus notabilis]|uniref:Aminopeptidase n=1 Tax=Morus notabilis TaxID=981085 RepID=W9QQW9_9ROSA|nr:Puromycin-sensitive aminopeptidase [Morus notabilis]